MTRGRLTPLQVDVLDAFFRRESRFFLTGGAALVGYYLKHRTTHDLDLFTGQKVLDEGEQTLSSVAAELGASLERVTTAPDFRRRLLRRADEAVVVDLVHDPTLGADHSPRACERVLVDRPDEIVANKLCAALSRAEIRDIVDLCALEEAGHAVEAALPRASEKDGGATPAQLAWVLSQISIGEDAELPGPFTRAELARYLADLVKRLAKTAYPSADQTGR